MKLPHFILPANDGKTYTDQDLQSGTFVVYLYPRDMTPGCTIESQNFRDLYPQFTKAGAQVFGLSKDSLSSHDRFCAKEALIFPLLSDEKAELIRKLDAWKAKNMYGKVSYGTERCTFVIRDGKIIREWRSVKVAGHAREVLDFIQTLT